MEVGLCLGFDDLDEDNKTCVLAIIQEIMKATDLRIRRRSSFDCIPLNELQQMISYIWKQLTPCQRITGLDPLDMKYLDFRRSLYVSALEDAEALLLLSKESSSSSTIELTVQQCQQLDNFPVSKSE